MKWQGSWLALALLSPTVFAQETLRGASGQGDPVPPTSSTAVVPLDSAGPLLCPADSPGGRPGGFLTGNRDFANFIGFLSNPLQNIDPRAMTALWPIFGSSWVSSVPALPDGDFQLYGTGLYLALSERLAVGMNQGGYAAAHFSRDRPGVFRDRFGRLRDRREFGGQREGWLNLGGCVQYTLLQDVPEQFLLTAGMRWEAPSGSQSIFQGRGPAYLAPYVTAGKEFGPFHVLATGGYEFPAGSGGRNTDFFYLNLHLDRQLFGWLYPLVEFNWTYHTSSVDLDLVTRRGFIDLGTFSSSGNILTLAVGANAVLIRDQLELGAVYTTPLATQRDFDFNGLLVKMLVRY